ncbi:MAG TPA: TonB-dependent receptor [Pyrinomonadaceae bacterium]
MKRVFTLVLAVAVISPILAAEITAATPAKSNLATIAGTVNDGNGKPVAGALVSLLKEGAKEVVKQIKTDAAGKFSTKISPGRYGLRAVAQGFNEVVFSVVEVRASQELLYRFNLEPVGTGKTLPEQRKDREDVKWTLRSSQTRRSIFQVQEEEAEDIRAALGIENASVETPGAPVEESDVRINTFDSKPQGVLETYFTSSPFGFSYAGLNFAIAAPATEEIDLVFAGQTGVGAGAPGRFEAVGRVRAGDHHRINLNVAGMQFARPVWTASQTDPRAVGQLSVRAIDEWIVRDGVVIVLGLDYSRFIGGGGNHSISPRVGIQFDATARTRLKAAYAPGGNEDEAQSFASFEDAQVVFSGENLKPVAYIDGQAVMERSHRLEFGVERVLDNNSTVEATAFFDTTSGRGVGLLSFPLSPLSATTGESLISVANQQGAARGMRVVYTRRLSRVWTASAGYSFGQGQKLNPLGFVHPDEVFTGGMFQTAAFQLGAGFRTGTRVRTVLRFSPQATVFAIDPFAGRLGVYDPSLSIQVTQELPSFGLPLRAEAVIDARNLMDTQATAEGNEILTQLSTGRRSVRGGISFRF